MSCFGFNLAQSNHLSLVQCSIEAEIKVFTEISSVNFDVFSYLILAFSFRLAFSAVIQLKIITEGYLCAHFKANLKYIQDEQEIL